MRNIGPRIKKKRANQVPQELRTGRCKHEQQEKHVKVQKSKLRHYREKRFIVQFC